MMDGRRLVLACSLAAALSGCTVISGKGMEEVAVDKTLTTASIPPIDPAVAAETLSDSRTVRNAVSAADMARADGAPLAWSNADTGASGTITAISETRAGDAVCRQFKTSRQRFDGVALYAGEACTTGQGEWTLTRFSEDR